ncbi:MAG: TIGR04283 family arsenosugar biosynthesis glycosyltransferase [Rhodospirillales bacterium]|nr:TIGR04283 family arsenosugar biosynthesis glycosyltransferase [Rhodospirillales bacterium]
MIGVMERIAVIIPALNAAAGLQRTLERVQATDVLAIEPVVVDGGSSDPTPELARALGVTLVEAARGRGSQLAAGAAASDAPWLFFLHADTWLDDGWDRLIAGFVGDRNNADSAAVFRLRFDDEASGARRVEWFASRRSRWLGLPYGDQGLVIARTHYDRLGGFKPIPIMEDVDMVRRIGRRRLMTLPCDAVTSPARYRRMGYTPRMLRNLVCLASYYLGVPPRVIVKLYG